MGVWRLQLLLFLKAQQLSWQLTLQVHQVTGIRTMLSGDAHLSNFGIFASPERKLIFDVNDFDECYPGPWEWDLKRLAVSAVVAGQDSGFKLEDSRELAKYVAKKYRKAITKFAGMLTLDLWYCYVDAERLLKAFSNSKKESKILKKVVKKARASTEEQSLEKFTEIVGGQRRFVNNPPLMVRLTDVPESDAVAEKVEVVRKDLGKSLA